MSCAAILLAGGSGTRLQREENKVYLQLDGRPLLMWSVDAFDRSPLIDRVVLVVRRDDIDRARSLVEAVAPTKLAGITVGGSTRQASEHAGLEALAGDIDAGEVDLVCIHDVARPFVTQRLIARVVTAARRTGGAIPGLPLDTAFLVRADADGSTPALLDTDDLRRVQTPQAFRADALLDAYRRAAAAGFSGDDTAASMERFADVEVAFVSGDPDNVKVTYVEDLVRAEEIAHAWDPEGR